jgi:tryptophan synthase alpha chain
MSELRPLEATLRARRDGGHKALVVYLMAGMTADWLEAAHAIVAAGADALEIGIPFSDPMIDGPVIQEAGIAALERSTTPLSVLEALAGADLGVPLAVMTYYNLVFRTGERRMARSLVAAGVSGAILPDLSLEELGPWAEEADAAGVETVLMVAPSTPPERAAALCQRSRGFVYAAARMAVTGERTSLGDQSAAVVARIRPHTDRPVYVGIGISSGAQAASVCETADGVIVGSAVVRRLLDGHGPEAAAAFVAELRAAIDA